MRILGERNVLDDANAALPIEKAYSQVGAGHGEVCPAQ